MNRVGDFLRCKMLETFRFLLCSWFCSCCSTVLLRRPHSNHLLTRLSFIFTSLVNCTDPRSVQSIKVQFERIFKECLKWKYLQWPRLASEEIFCALPLSHFQDTVESMDSRPTGTALHGWDGMPDMAADSYSLRDVCGQWPQGKAG